MRKANIILICVIAVVALAIGGYFVFEKVQHEMDLAAYPTAYTDLIQRYAEEFSIDPYLVTAIMRCESSNDADALSSKGAVGLMQIMPDTGAWIAHKLGMDALYQEAMLAEPTVNIRFACWYLNFLNGRFDGKRSEVIAAYNAGQGSVEGWLADPQYSENGRLTVIPYPETARYVVKVTTAYEKYTVLYPELYSDAVDETPAP